MGEITAVSPEQIRASRQWMSPLVVAGVIAGLLAFVFFEFFRRQVLFAVTQQADWGHTLVIPLIAGYFVYLNRHQLCAKPFKPAWAGLLPVIMGVGIYTLCSVGPNALRHHNLQGLGVGLSVVGLVLMLFGWRAMKWLWFPLLYVFVFGQTISDRFMSIVTFQMQDIAAVGSYWMMKLIGLDVDRSGNTLYLMDSTGVPNPLNIAEACSGMRMLMAFLALGVAMAYTGLRHTWQKIALVIMAVPTAIFVNILRVVTLGLLSLVNSNFAAGDFHSFIGLLWLVPAFLIYLAIMWVLRRIVIDPPNGSGEAGEDAEASIRFAPAAKSAAIVACVVLAISGIGFQLAVGQLNVHLKKLPVDLRDNFANIPKQLDGWHAPGVDEKLEEATLQELGTDKYLDRAYFQTDGESSTPEMKLDLHLAYYTGMIDAVPHVPDRCFIAGGFKISKMPENLDLDIDRSFWRPHPELVNLRTGEPYPVVTFPHSVTGRPVRVNMPIGDIQLRTTTFEHPEHPGLNVYAGYFFIANGGATPTPGGVKRLAFDRSERYAYYCKVQLTGAGGPELDEDAFLSYCADFLGEFLPELMRCLPDWAEVERQSEQVPESKMVAKGD